MADERIKVWPKPGQVIRDEYTFQPIPEDGAEVKRTRLTDRRIVSGDLLTDDPRAAAEPVEAVAEEPEERPVEAVQGE